jgi:hypothetical protein
MNKFEKNTVSVDSVVKHDGMTKIFDLLYNEGFTARVSRIELLKIAGGRERVNSQGKLTKRIKRNLRRDYDITLSDKAIQEIGNIMDRHSLSARDYIVEYTADLKGTIGNFGDNRSCFKRGGECRNNLLAMQDHGQFSAFRVYKTSGENLARAWAYTAHGGATVLFNGYGIALDKIAILAAKLEDTEPRIVTVCSDVYINSESACYAIGGDRTYYEFYASVDDYDDDDLSWCSLCEDCLPYEGLHHVGTQSLCQPCYDKTYQTCGHCGENCHRIDNPLFKAILRGETRYVCGYCRDRMYHQCAECSDYYRQDAIMNDGDTVYCFRCAKKLGAVVCYDCQKWIIPDRTFLIQYTNKDFDHDPLPVCESCRVVYYECDTCNIDLPYLTCPTCETETVARTPHLDADIAELERTYAVIPYLTMHKRHNYRMAAYSLSLSVAGMEERMQFRKNLTEIRRHLYRDAIKRAAEVKNE